jgi:hypothetical protein
MQNRAGSTSASGSAAPRAIDHDAPPDAKGADPMEHTEAGGCSRGIGR